MVRRAHELDIVAVVGQTEFGPLRLNRAPRKKVEKDGCERKAER